MSLAYLKTSICCCAILMFSLVATAQTKSMAGSVSDSTTGLPVGLASIRNVLNGKTIISKIDGSFIADLSEGQVLAFTANGYYTDTLTISAEVLQRPTLNIILTPLRATLQDVTVTANYNPYYNDSLERRNHFLQTVGKNKINAIGRSNDLGFGVAINLDHFKKSERTKREARNLFEVIEEDAYVNYRWNRTVVEKYTNFSGDELILFMQNSRPKYEWLRSHLTEEDLLYYINAQLKKMKKQPVQKSVTN